MIERHTNKNTSFKHGHEMKLIASRLGDDWLVKIALIWLNCTQPPNYLLSSCDVNKRNHTKRNTTLTKHAWLSYIEMIINNAAGLVMFRIKNLKTVSLNQNHELIVNAKRFRKHTRSHRAMTTIKLRLCNYNFKNETWASKIKNSHVSCGLCTFYMVK